MITLYHAPHSRSSRVIWLLEELGASYDLRYVSIRYGDGSGDGPDAANVHPDKKVPALVHDGALVTESTAIAIYLCDLFPKAGLAPAVGAAERGAYLAWLCWTDNELAAAIFGKLSGRGDDPRVKLGYEAAVRRLDEALARGPSLMGEHFTAADVMVGATIAWARAHLPPSAAIDAYVERVTGRPANIRALAKDAPGQLAA